MKEAGSTYTALLEQAEKTVALRRSKAFRRKLFFARIKKQLFSGDAAERKDLGAFLSFKLGNKDRQCRPLSDFDPTNGIEKETAQKLISIYGAAPHGRQAVIFSRLQYYTSGGGQRGAQIAKTLKKQGFDVLFIYIGDNYYTFDKDFIDELDLHLPLAYFEPEQLAGLLKPNAVAVFENPDGSFLPYLEALKKRGAATVYEHIDNWESQLGEGWYRREDYLAFINKADLLVGTARNLCSMLENDCGRSVLYSANAVDESLFDPNREYKTPADMPIGNKTLLYYGHLDGEWLDWELLYETARLLPDCSFVIIGYGGVDKKARIPQNVHFIGAKKQCLLPAYLAASDMALLHFKTGTIGSYVSPLKVFEYLAMHKPVIATPLPDIEGYPNVYCASSAAEWAGIIKDPPAPVPCGDFIAANSWAARCKAILAEVDK